MPSLHILALGAVALLLAVAAIGATRALHPAAPDPYVVQADDPPAGGHRLTPTVRIWQACGTVPDVAGCVERWARTGVLPR